MAERGLKANAVGLFGGTLVGISSVAPAYVLTATFGILAIAVCKKTPVVLVAGFLPMFFGWPRVQWRAGCAGPAVGGAVVSSA